MNFRYGALPNGQGPLPVVPLDLPDAPGLRVLALVDSGAMGIRLDAALATALGIDISQYTPTALAVAGQGNLLCYHVPAVRMGIRGRVWQASVGFVSPWQHGHAILGQAGFFDQWDVRFDAAHGQFSIRS